MSTPKIALPRQQLTDFCQRWSIIELALFGSILRDDFSSTSDIDILITFAPEAKRGAFALAQMQAELAAMFGREVDLVSKRAIERSQNWLRRKNILESAQIFMPRDQEALIDIWQAAQRMIRFTQDVTRSDMEHRLSLLKPLVSNSQEELN